MTSLNPTRARLLETFALDVPMVRGSGVTLVGEDGREYLDCLAQYGALPFGHNPPQIWEALNRAQNAQVPAMLQPLRPVMAEHLASRLAEITPGDLRITTLTNSGAETVEAAIKLARAKTGRNVILSTWNGFHGKTLGALAATGKPMYQKHFGVPTQGFDYVPFGDIASLEVRLAQSADDIAAFIVEPIQGEGGVIVPPSGYIDTVIRLCRRYGVLVILDEIQTGLGRTGELFACSLCQETPDILLLAKALGGGLFPIGACVVRPTAWDEGFGRLHSSTFANNNLAAAAALASIDLLLDDDAALIGSVRDAGRYFLGRLQELHRAYPSVIADVRGQGFMIGLEFQQFDERNDSATMAFCSLNGGVTALFSSYMLNRHGILTAPLFNSSHVMRIQLPLIAGRAEIDRVVDALGALCAAIADRRYDKIVKHLVTRDRAKSGPVHDVAPEIPPKPNAPAKRPGQFAFLIHYTEEDDIRRSDPSFGSFDEDELSVWTDWVKRLGPGYVRRIPTVTSKAGATADGWLLSVPMLPGDMRGKGRDAALSMIRGAVDMAAEDGASRVGLGAFTSIVARGGEMVTDRGVPITSGNTLTTVAAVKSIEAMARRAGISLTTSHVVVVGASGAIGRLAALLLARRAGRMTLVGNDQNPFAPALLGRVADEVYWSLSRGMSGSFAWPGELSEQIRDIAPAVAMSGVPGEKGLASRFDKAFERRGLRSPLERTTDLDSALREADIVLVATSADTALVDPRALPPGVLVCDVARPPNVERADLSESGVLVFDGGLIKPPSSVDLGPFQTLPENLCWGCLGETMLLALAGEERHFSIGSKLSLEDADRIAQLANEHGFEPAPAQWYGDEVTDEEIQRFARAVEWTGQLRARRTASRPMLAPQHTAPQERVHAAE